MNPLYQEVYSEALSKIAEFGADVTITRGAFTYDPAKGARTGTTKTVVKKGLRIADFSRLISDFRIIGNASTMKIDIGMMFGGDIDFKDDDTFEVGGVKYSIVQVKKIAPAGLVILQYVLGRV